MLAALANLSVFMLCVFPVIDAEALGAPICREVGWVGRDGWKYWYTVMLPTPWHGVAGWVFGTVWGVGWWVWKWTVGRPVGVLGGLVKSVTRGVWGGLGKVITNGKILLERYGAGRRWVEDVWTWPGGAKRG